MLSLGLCVAQPPSSTTSKKKPATVAHKAVAPSHTATRSSATHHATSHAVSKAHATSASHSTAHHVTTSETTASRFAAHRSVHISHERFYTQSFIDNAAAGDNASGEDPVVRAAAMEALGSFNGTVLAIDPSTGRILTMVNQKLALSAGAEPCSTIKVAVALAGLKEGIITADMPVNLGGHYTLDLTHALAKSVNLYFEVVGRALGFDRVKEYANEFGLGELAGYNIEGEQLGVYPSEPLPQAQGGVGRMCSFGESISMTPLQLGALVGAVANGGTLYYLQHPTNEAELAAFKPQVKRVLDIQGVIPQLLPGMSGAVNFSNGTARSLRTNFIHFPVFGKTGTCSDNGTRFGWFVSYGDAPTGRIVTVIFLHGDRSVYGPKAAELTGAFYKAMWERNYFRPGGTAPSQDPATPQPAVPVASAFRAPAVKGK